MSPGHTDLVHLLPCIYRSLAQLASSPFPAVFFLLSVVLCRHCLLVPLRPICFSSITIIMMMMMMITTTTTTKTATTTTTPTTKALFEIFYNLLTAPRTVSNTHAQVARAQSCTDHVQHVQHVVCHSSNITITRGLTVTTCPVAKRSHTQISDQDGDFPSCVWGSNR